MRQLKHYAILLSLVMLLAACQSTPLPSSDAQDESLTIVATIFPIGDLAENIAGDNANVVTLIPPGADPHSFELTAADLVALESADVLLSLGLEFERLEERLIDIVPSIVNVDAKQGIQLIEAEEEDHHDHGDEEEHDDHEDEHHDDEHAEDHHDDDHADDHEDEHHDDEHADDDHADDHHDHAHDHSTDPHIWVSLKNMQKIATTLSDALAEHDPANAEMYRQNAEKYIAQLKTLDERYAQELASCSQDTILVNHNAFSYLAADYRFTQLAISGLSVDSEPSSGELIEIVEEAQEHSIQFVYYDVFLSKRAAETIANEIGATLLPLNTGVSKDEESDTYLSIMNRNLGNLKQGLECTS